MPLNGRLALASYSMRAVERCVAAQEIGDGILYMYHRDVLLGSFARKWTLKINKKNKMTGRDCSVYQYRSLLRIVN